MAKDKEEILKAFQQEVNKAIAGMQAVREKFLGTNGNLQGQALKDALTSGKDAISSWG